MDRYCQALAPEMGARCINWFRDALQHCTRLIAVTPQNRFLAKALNLVFPSRHDSILKANTFINTRPNELTVQNCEGVLLDVLENCVERAPQAASDAMLRAWQKELFHIVIIWLTLFGILLYVGIVLYKKYFEGKQKPDPLSIIFSSEKRVQAAVARNLRVVKYEMQVLHVEHCLQPEDILAMDGSWTLVVKIALNSSVEGDMLTVSPHVEGRFFRLVDSDGYKPLKMNKMINYFNKCHKTHVMMVLDKETYGLQKKSGACKNTDIIDSGPTFIASPRRPFEIAKLPNIVTECQRVHKTGQRQGPKVQCRCSSPVVNPPQPSDSTIQQTQCQPQNRINERQAKHMRQPTKGANAKKGRNRQMNRNKPIKSAAPATAEQ